MAGYIVHVDQLSALERSELMKFLSGYSFLPPLDNRDGTFRVSWADDREPLEDVMPFRNLCQIDPINGPDRKS